MTILLTVIIVLSEYHVVSAEMKQIESLNRFYFSFQNYVLYDMESLALCLATSSYCSKKHLYNDTKGEIYFCLG